jgi:Cu2+-exporting ATPase
MFRDKFWLASRLSGRIIACPHALGLAIPLVIAISTSLGAQKGHHRRSRGPSSAPMNAQNETMAPYQTAMKGIESSAQ